MLTPLRLSFFFAVGALLLPSCRAFDWGWDNDHYREDFHYSYPLTSGGQLTLENANGSVEISGWDQNKVEITGTKYASSRDLLSAIRIEIVPSASSIQIRTVMPSNNWDHSSRGASYVIHVPRRVLLDDVHTSNGAIRVSDVDGTVRLRTSNGAIRAGSVRGEIELETSNGAIDLADDSGNVRAHTSNGPIRGQLHDGALDAGTSNGAIEVSLRNPPPDRRVKADSSNGKIELTVDASRLPEIRATTSNSSIAVRLPSSASARLDAGTSHGSITSDFDLLMHGGHIGGMTHVEGTIGGGGPVIELNSSNGSIQILKL